MADAIADSVRQAAEEGGIGLADITAIGVGAPGQVDMVAGTLSQAGNLPGWQGVYSLGPELTSRLGAPVKLVGFARMALGEGIEKEEKDFASEVAAQLRA